ncbi:MULTISPECIES: TIGR02452 family protein [unclassified Streptomyces]|uniref:TIGR02452 family protein n=1 Tax=unclassified Streptomyces TaxID=2593676 RepID=UPI00136D1161|nr:MULTISPECIES: TIGR02452 family protein [unclassified Streptomyces]NEA02129.1 TIGR02452 family protein [Streptomyces sp. SID10116]MYY83875.1 TIGR02452 family protein [Streptomyces sp. SID335]MYZ17233.1 TIGR02452 family protein [Streptomyces sp. SID337]NDZ87660.1 TIGR02452 family protein [Streptomyces sp. SID10115]NEB50022.1 TIGR02452 family protein [Streptomyces sp. SID339]
MSARLRGQAQETERIVATGAYVTHGGRETVIADAVAAARAGTRMFGPDPVEVPPRERVEHTRFEVTGESSLEAARRLTADEPSGSSRLAVLNFSSARNPGGGYLNGAQAQEEALCRASALYTCLLEVPGFYAHHRADRDPFYTDRVIHSPGVPVFRDDRGRLLDEPYTVGFLTSAAPNAGVIRRTAPERAPGIARALSARAERVLETAAACGYHRLVLGAWGCGVFMNDPAHVAGAFRGLLGEGGRFAGQFTHVVFGVLDRTRGAVTRGAFETEFAELCGAGAQRQP